MGLFSRLFGAGKQRVEQAVEAAKPYVAETMDKLDEAVEVGVEKAKVVANTVGEKGAAFAEDAKTKTADAADAISVRLRGSGPTKVPEDVVLAGDRPKKAKKAKAAD